MRLIVNVKVVLFVCFLFIRVMAYPTEKNELCQPDTSVSVGAWGIVINEIMADPDPPVGTIVYPEYIELYNKQNTSVTLKSWKLCVGAVCKTIKQVTIPADGFLVITSPNATSIFPLDINVIGLTGFPTISNSGQLIQLLNEKGNVISAISYSDEWYNDPIKKQGGYSLEQMDPFNPCAEQNNWTGSIGNTGGTPGKKNSVRSQHPDVIHPRLLRVNSVSENTVEAIFSEPLDSTTLLYNSTYTIIGMGNPIKINLIKPFFKSMQLTLPSRLQNGVFYELKVTNTITDCAGNKIESGDNVRFALPDIASPGDIIINEVLFNPREKGVDFVEIFNRSEKVIDLRNMFLCRFDSITQIVESVEKISAGGYLLFPSTYLLLSKSSEIIQTNYVTKDPDALLTMTNLPALNAANGTICIKTATSIIDYFYYDENMHFDLLTSKKGISLERVQPNRPSNDRTNWHSAASIAGFATPGYQNSQYMAIEESEDPLTLTTEIFSPDGDGFNDILGIGYNFLKPELTGTLLIYDCKGRLIKTLIKNELLGTRGVVNWDGKNDTNGKVCAGIYIIYLHVFDLSNYVKGYKKTCVIAN